MVDQRDHSEDREFARPPSAHGLALGVLAILAIVYTLYFARAIVLPIVCAVVAALILRPMVRALEKVRLPSMLAALVVVGGAVGGIVGGLSLVVEPAGQWIGEIPDHLTTVRRRLGSLRSTLAGVSIASDRIEEIASTPGEERPIPVEVEQPAINNPVFGQTGAFLTSASVATVITFFLLARLEVLTSAVLGFLEVSDRRERVREGMIRVERGLSRYLFTVTLVNAVLGVVTGTALWLLGMPNPVLWGVMAMFLNYVPFIGAWTGTVVVGLVAAVTFPDPLAALVPPVVFLALTSIEGNLITPMILGTSMSLDPLVVFLSLVVFGWMWGVVGAVVAVPLLAIAKSVCAEFERAEPIALLIGGESRRRWSSDRLAP